MTKQQTDPVDALIDRIAEAVVRKIEEKEKIDAIAQAVLARLQEQEAAGPGKTARRTTAKPGPPKPNAKATPKRTARPSAKKAKAR